jgi:hypothetical protein
MVDVTAENTRTRAEVTKRSFLQDSGDYTGRASTGTKGIRIELVESGDVFEHLLAEFSPGVIAAAAAFGLVTSITNTVGGKSLSAEERKELMQDRIDTLLEGEWSAERQSGPRSSQLLEAWVRVRTEAGKESTQEWKDKVSIELRDNPEKQKALLANPQVAAAYAAIKAEASIARAKRLAEKAGESTADDDILGD